MSQHQSQATDLQSLLAELHTLTAEQLVKVIRDGVPVADEETGKIHYAPAPAAYIAQAVNLLKHNNIQAPPKGKARDTLSLLGKAVGRPEDDDPADVLPFPPLDKTA